MDIESVTEGDISYTLTRYRPRTEGLFAKIEKWVAEDMDTHWRVTTKDNVPSYYGQTSDARISDPDDETRVFQWLLEESRDAKGNRIAYEYTSENGDNVTLDIGETSRCQTANRYPTKIKYGHYLDGDADGWHFEVIFDYGERTDPTAYETTNSWPKRSDSFSSYKSGFERRTHRLCHSILMFHRFGGEPFLVRATQFEYEQTPTMTFLIGVRQVGYREDETKEMPLEFSYSTYDPTQLPTSQPLTVEAGEGIPGFINQGGYQLVDLYGEGIPGVLYSDDATVLYWRPKGEGQFSPPMTPNAFPIERNLQNGEYALMDLGGDGKLDLVVTEPGRSGFYECHPDGSWDSYQSLASAPTDLNHPHKEMADVTGDGFADLLIFEADAVKVYPSKGKEGYGPALRQTTENQLPVTTHPYAEEAIRLRICLVTAAVISSELETGWSSVGQT